MNDLHARWFRILVVGVLTVVGGRAAAHPGSGIVVDREGQVYVVDMVRGVWKLDGKGALTHMPGPGFHWMALDSADRFANTSLPRGASGDVERIGKGPTLLLASDYPIAIGSDGNLYYPTHSGPPVKIMRVRPTGESSVFATLPGPVGDLNGLAAAPDGSLYYSEDRAIRRIAKDGKVSIVVENVAVAGCGAPLLRGLDIDAAGAVHVAATGCRNVLVIAPGGKITVAAQVKDAWPPTGVALSGKAVYVLEFEKADSDDRREMLPRIRKISEDGTTRVVGTVTHH